MSDAKHIHQFLISAKKTLVLAESCTGGHLAAVFTSMPDASKYFLGSMVAYSDALKQKLLGVKKETLRENGAVSRSIAHEMWLGAMKVAEADYGIAVTGTAGPSGGTKEKPVGTVVLCIGEKGKKPHVLEICFQGEDRLEVIRQAVAMALKELSALLQC